ncbi:hypothetical protein CEK71_09865 [Methylovulum psychrotolerans]|uniref:Uncharacterized protein n=2 Tax=Methylovulum psychrotolerans TaxID=1704499 RepID=A0A1Z4BYM7_9GAMM|nr:hypothetical protein CEK71_09865 [Methylovulum psychrotolerans]
MASAQKDYDFKPTKDIIDEITEQSRHRPIVPFIGSGISVAAGYPSIGSVIHYLAKVLFAIEFGVYKDRLPQLDGDGKDKLLNKYRQHPSQYMRDFGWPNLGNLDTDLWNWIDKDENKNFFKANFNDELENDELEVEYRDSLLAIVQWVLRREQRQRDSGTTRGIEEEWRRWKCRRKRSLSSEECKPEPKLLYGDWEILLDKLCEGDFALADQLFSEFEQGLYPTQAHRLLVFLQAKLGIPLMMSTNFDSFLERAFNEEGINPKIFDIHRDAELPDYSLVNHQFSILKLHGSAYGLRLGERLKLQLETDARQNALKYLPKNALILVIGFSGSERRMMQLLNAFIEADNENTEELDFLEENKEKKKLKLIWIQGPSNPGPLYDELTINHGEKITACQIRHADTFLQELYFQIANSHQSANNPYSSLPGHNYLTALSLNLPKEDDNAVDRLKAIQIFYDDQSEEINLSGQTEKNISKSWATLAGAAFVQSLAAEGYRIIWIDVENHRTLESVLAEIFFRIQLIDSLAPGFNISIPLEISDDNANKAINKAASRIFDVLKRGKFVLALDSLDSFGRQPLGHHGIPNYKHKEEELDNTFKQQMKRLTSLIEKLILDHNKNHDDKKIHDSYIVLTIEKPSIRHPLNNKDEKLERTYKETQEAIRKIIDIAERHDISVFKNPDAPFCDYSKFNKEAFNEIPTDKATKNYSENWLLKEVTQEGHLMRALKRSKDVYDLLSFIKATKKEGNPVDELNRNPDGILTAFVCWLSIFRRPRTLPVLRGMVSQWAIGQDFVPEEDEKSYHQNFRNLLALIMPHKKCSHKHNSNFIGEYDNLISLQNRIGIVAQQLEGGSIWLFREAHEACYEALTQNVHLQKWVDAWPEKARPDDLSAEAAILDGMIVVNWHLQAAINCHVNVYLPTKDVQAFYEYFYHRISALRVITLLIEIICWISNDEWKDIEDKVVHESQKMSLDWLRPKDNESIFYCFAQQIGTFSEISDPDPKTLEAKREHLLVRLLKLRCSLFKKTYMSLKRNVEPLIAYSVPEIVWSWSRHILTRDLPEISFKEPFESKLVEEKYDDSAFDQRAVKFKILLKNLELKALYAKLDFDFEGLRKETLEDNFEEKIAKIRCLLQQNNIEALKRILEEEKYLENKINNEKEQKLDIEKTITRLGFMIEKNTYKVMTEDELKLLQEFLKKNEANEPSDTEKNLRDLYAYGAKSILAKWTVWGYFNKRIFFNYKENREIKALLENLTDYTKKYELFLRKTCDSKDEELIHRNECFAIKARVLYLQEQFQKAHGYLDLAGSNHQPKEIEHRVNAGMVHILRAELLAISADSHYKICLEQKEQKLFLNQEIGASLKKIDRAEQELNLAKNVFGTMSHQKLWQVYMELGFARLKLERMLFELEELYLNWRQPNQDEYLKISGKIEQTIIDTLGYLRSVFDLLPFNSSDWASACKSEDVFSNDLPSLTKIEIISYALWNSLFIVGIFYSALLGLSEKKENKEQKWKLPPTIHEAFSNVVCIQFMPYALRWKAWNKSMRFHKMHTMPLTLELGREMRCENGKETVQEIPEISGCSIREIVIQIIEYQNTKTRIGEIWDKRREETSKQAETGKKF